jgi:alpha-galactosidase
MRRLNPILLAAITLPACAQTIRPTPAAQQWTLDAGDMSYVIGVNDQHMLQSLYWGPKLSSNATFPPAKANPERASFDPSIATTPLEYAGWGAGLFTEPALKIDSSDGDRTLILLYQDVHITGSQLEITLKDATEPVLVHLYYQPYAGGILARWTRIENTGAQPIRIEQAASATWNLPRGTGYQWSWLTGQWAAEWQLHTAPIQPGTALIESRRGSTSHQANPWFSVGRTDETTETSGPVWFGELGWSGSWRLTVEDTALAEVRITAGFNPFDFSYTLARGESLQTPRFYAGYTQQGRGEASRILHRFQLAEILPGHQGENGPDPKPRPILYNSWEATEFNVSEAGQIALAEKAAKLGVERFVIDDGWFGQRKDDHAGLGDWYVNPQKFPHGLKPVIDRVHALGMSFGIWVEPEMVNPDSDLYRAHPDWAMHFPNRQRTEQRNQLVLNLARQDVKDYIFHFLDQLVTENDIAFLKWDYNRNWSEPGWQDAPDGDQKEIYVRYVQNLYDILAHLREKHPNLEIESCSGGGGRVDLGILRYTDEVWTSDNTDALDRLSIQDGFTHAYAPQIMVAWVTDVPNFNGRSTPLQFRFLTAMQGALGVGASLNKFTDAEMSESASLIALYKSIRTTIAHGKLYRLTEPAPPNPSADPSQPSNVEYVSQDGAQAVVLAYLHSQRFGLAYPTIHLRGLDPNATYTIEPLHPNQYTGPKTVSGSILMGEGLNLNLTGDYDSTELTLTRQ